MQLLLFALLPLPVSFRMSQLNSMTEFVVFMELILGSPEYWDVIVNPKFLGFFEWGWGEPSCFLFFTTVVEDGGSIGSGFPPEYFLIGAGESQTPDVDGCDDVDAAAPLRYFLLGSGDSLTHDVEGIAAGVGDTHGVEGIGGVGGGMVTQVVQG